MSQKLPLCAFCGESLVRSGRILIEFSDLPGNPQIGWHDRCAKEDEIFQLAINELLDENRINESVTVQRAGARIADSLFTVFKRDSRRMSVKRWGPKLEDLFSFALNGE
jgi:hypothetical protein